MHVLTQPRYIAMFLIAVIIVITAVLGILMSLLFMSQKRHRAFQASLFNLKVQHANNLLHSQVRIQEMTFRNIAQEIHDNINLSLTLAKLNLHQVAAPQEVRTAIAGTVELISNAITDLSSISRGLNAEFIQQAGLFGALHAEIERIHRASPLRVVFETVGEPVFQSAQEELLIFRSVQECFNNILKHAKATTATLCLEYDTERIRVEIKDNGIGFTAGELAAKRGESSGLNTLRGRFALFSGSFSVQSSPGEGTKLTFELPIGNPNEKEQDAPDSSGRRPLPPA